ICRALLTRAHLGTRRRRPCLGGVPPEGCGTRLGAIAHEGRRGGEPPPTRDSRTVEVVVARGRRWIGGV
ncbi:hypothetical protein T484DRAFT_1922710, partial [Baffinella frigidus]